jgi:hypothetical protein
VRDGAFPKQPAPSRPPRQEYDSLKEFPARTLDQRRLGSLLRRLHPQLLEHLRATRTVASFRRTFLLEEPPAAAPPRRTRMPSHLWGQLVGSEAVVRVSRPEHLPFSCALRLIPDRKNARLARVIFPVVPLNKACRRPPPTPTPRLHHLLEGVLAHKRVATADLKGWFFALAIPACVAAAFFAVRHASGWFGARRGLLGWTWMPYIMASVAVAMVQEAMRRAAALFPRRSACAFVWIDNFVIGTDDDAHGREALDQLRAVADHLGASLHEVTPPATKARVVGTEVDLVSRAWRLSSAWAAGFVAMAAAFDTARTITCQVLWRLMGGASWVAYVAQLPQLWLAPVYDYAGALARKVHSRALSMRSVVQYPRRVRDCVRAAATYAAQNPWRRFGARMTRPVFSDASGDGGVGLMVPARKGLYAVHAERVADPPHINVLELLAALKALLRSSPPPGSTVPLVLDNSVATYQFARFSAAAPRTRRLLALAAEWAARRRVALDPALVPSALQPADEPSRSGTYKKHIHFDPGPVLACARRVRRDRAAICILPPGWARPVFRKEFLRAVIKTGVSQSENRRPA